MTSTDGESNLPSLNPTPSVEEPLRLPGYGAPVNWTKKTGEEGEEVGANWYRWKTNFKRTAYPNAVESWGPGNLTVREISMMRVMNELTDKPDWNRKVFDTTIVAKWKSEALGTNFSEAMFDYCIDELREKTKLFSETGLVYVFDSQATIVKSDSAIPAALAADLIDAVQPLEAIPESRKDWHPGSEDKVLDLVHPSLYPLMYGKSRVLPTSRIPSAKASLEFCGHGVIVPYPSKNELCLNGESAPHLYNGRARADMRWQPEIYDTAAKYHSSDFQWLPCNVSFRPSTQKSSAHEPCEVEITSYINNLHPIAHSGLYKVLEKVIARTIPLWDACLGYFDNEHPKRIEMEATEYDHPDGDERPLEDGENPDSPGAWDRNFEWECAHRVLRLPEPGSYVPIDPASRRSISLAEKFAAQGLQVIVKLANIELSPGGKEEYGGGTWHVEGQLNEHICASAIYYYSQGNITPSRLSFRQSTTHEDVSEKTFDQDDYSGVEEIYGIEQHGPCLQNLGSVLTKEGRIIAFPNMMQHQVQPFRLADPTRPGYRKILALFLVDPYVPILSTANITPQQRDWWADSLFQTPQGLNAANRWDNLPPEIREQVFDEVDGKFWPISLEEAKNVRVELIKQRGSFVERVNKDFEREGFSFCEH